MKGRIECALFHAKYMVRSALDELRDAVAMHCALSQCFEHQHVERALNQVARFVLRSHKPFMDTLRRCERNYKR